MIKIKFENSYKNRAYYTKYKATLTNSGTIKNLEVWEEVCDHEPYGHDMTFVYLPNKAIEEITGANLELAKVNTIKVLENAILKGEI